MFKVTAALLAFLAVQQPCTFAGQAAADKPAAPAAGQSELTLALATDKAEYVIGEEVQAEVTLTNGGDRALDVAQLAFEERSLVFDVTFESAPGKTKNFTYTVLRPDPHLIDRVVPTRVSLRPKKSVSGIFRIPVLRTGPLTVTAVYKGSDKEVRSTPSALKVAAQADGSARLAAFVTTSQGDFQIDLLPEEAPNSVASFVQLARSGFYNNLNFHRVIKGGWIQSGCPYDNGFGHPGYATRSEAEQQTVVYEPGTVGLSQNMKTGFAGSQFFVTLSRQQGLDKKFTVIGRVPESRMETVKKIGVLDTDKNTDRPSKEDVQLKGIKIIAVK